MPRRDIRRGTPAPFYAQHFLTGAEQIERLLRLTDIGEQDSVLEIGPGKGHITRALLRRRARVTAVEIDPALALRLRNQFIDEPNLELIQADFLQWNPPALGSRKVFSNIPFNRTTEILRRLTECAHPPQAIWLIMEHGAAKRFCGRPAETPRSLQLKPAFDVRIAAKIPREAYHPAPTIETALLECKRKAQPDIPPARMPAWRRFVDRAFKSPDGLRDVFTKPQLRTALRIAKIPPGATSGEILYTQWLCLFRCYETFNPKR